MTEGDYQLVEEGGWKCVNGHPYCNRCASPVDLTEESLEQMLIKIRDSVDRSGKRIKLEPSRVWYLKPGESKGLKLFERQKPVVIRQGRRWFRD